MIHRLPILFVARLSIVAASPWRPATNAAAPPMIQRWNDANTPSLQALDVRGGDIEADSTTAAASLSAENLAAFFACKYPKKQNSLCYSDAGVFI